MPVCVFDFLLHGEYSKFFIVATFSSKSFSSKTPSLVKNSSLLIFPDDKAEIYQSYVELCYARFCYQLT